MRWDVREAASARRSIWFATATVSSSLSMSRPDKFTKAKHSSQRWPGGCFIDALAKVVGRTG